MGIGREGLRGLKPLPIIRQTPICQSYEATGKPFLILCL